jgi:hypothetical protein
MSVWPQSNCLSELPDDEKVILSLKGLLNELTSDLSRDAEVSESARALALHARRNPRLRDDILKMVLQYIPHSVEDGFGDSARQHHIRELLYVCESIGGTDDKTAQQALRFADDFRTPEKFACRQFVYLVVCQSQMRRMLENCALCSTRKTSDCGRGCTRQALHS